MPAPEVITGAGIGLPKLRGSCADGVRSPAGGHTASSGEEVEASASGHARRRPRM